MNRAVTPVVIAACGALSYAISKIDLALRGELGMPGFPASPASYNTYDPVSGQFSNAVVGFGMVVLIGALCIPINKVWLRRAVLAANGLGAAAISVMVVSFAVRATGIAPVIGEPAIGMSTWITLAVGAVWATAWWWAMAASAVGKVGAGERVTHVQGLAS